MMHRKICFVLKHLFFDKSKFQWHWSMANLTTKILFFSFWKRDKINGKKKCNGKNRHKVFQPQMRLIINWSMANLTTKTGFFSFLKHFFGETK